MEAEPLSSPEEMGKDEFVVYTEELAGTEDYWLSITDAARVCRVQDVSIRRAITRGSLPVRRLRAGMNKRTRFVRASDLPKSGFPIIDESAAITTEIGKADILSIPRQQQQIAQDHQQFLISLANMQETFIQEQAQVRAHSQQQEERFQSALQVVQAKSAEQLAALTTRLTQQQEQLQQDLATAEQRHTEAHQAIQQAFAQIQTAAHQQETRLQEQFLERQQEVQARLSAQYAEFQMAQGEIKQSLEHLATTQQNALLAYQEQIQQVAQEALTQITLCKQSVLSSLEAAQHTTGTQLSHQAAQSALLQQSLEALRERLITQNLEWERARQQQQTQLDQHEQLLLPYSGQRLATEEMVAQATQGLADLETRLLAAQKQEYARYQPLLAFLIMPGRLEALERLLTEAMKK